MALHTQSPAVREPGKLCLQRPMIRRRMLIITMVLLAGLACQAVSVVPGGTSESATASPAPPAPSATPAPAVPPSEPWIAMVNLNNVWVIHPDGSGLRQITNNPPPPENDWDHNDIVLGWSPDGQVLALSQGTNLYLVDMSTWATTTLLTDTNGAFQWSPTGDEIIYDEATVHISGCCNFRNTGIWAVDPQGRNKRSIVPSTDEFPAIINPQWSPDGAHVIVTRTGGFEPGLSYYVTPAGSSSFADLMHGGNAIPHCLWSPIQSVVACTRSNEGPSGTHSVHFFNSDGQPTRVIPLPSELTEASLAAWSPDGGNLLLTLPGISTGEDINTTVILSLSDGAFQTFSSGQGIDWSPDGAWILAVDWAAEAGVAPTITIVDASSGQAFPLSEGYAAAWQPSSSGSVAVASQAPQTPATGATASAEPICTSADLTLVDTPKGNYLQMCAEGKQFEVGPLENGGYAMGPNGKFYVYCANSGPCYAARLGDTRLTPIGNVKSFSIIRRGEAPVYYFEFHGENPYTVQVFEDILKQNETLAIPHYITADN